MRRFSIADCRLPIGVTAICVVALVVIATTAPLAANGQQKTNISRIGYLSPRPGPSFYDDAFLKGLRGLGYVEGQNIAIQFRWANWNPERLAAYAVELAHLNVDVIVSTGGSAPALAAKHATAAIPIVFVTGDPVGLGLVSSLSRPGGNLTGVNILTTELNAKRLDLLKEALPVASRVGVLANPGPPVYGMARRSLEDAARSLALRLHIEEVRGPKDVDIAFAAMGRAHVDALLVVNDPLLFAQRGRITGLAAKSHLPGIYEWREFVEAGGLMSYGADLASLYSHAATYVDKILKGATPADLPIEQPTTFELTVNLKTAKALGLRLPQSILLRADKALR